MAIRIPTICRAVFVQMLALILRGTVESEGRHRGHPAQPGMPTPVATCSPPKMENSPLLLKGSIWPQIKVKLLVTASDHKGPSPHPDVLKGMMYNSQSSAHGPQNAQSSPECSYTCSVSFPKDCKMQSEHQIEDPTRFGSVDSAGNTAMCYRHIAVSPAYFVWR